MTWDEIIERVSKILAELFDAQALLALIPGAGSAPEAAGASKETRQAWLQATLAALTQEQLAAVLEQARRARPGSIGLMIVQSEFERWVKQQDQVYRGLRPGEGGEGREDAVSPPIYEGHKAQPPIFEEWKPLPSAAPPGREESKVLVPAAVASSEPDVAALRLDVRAPERVELGRAFTLAAAVRQLASPQLDEEGMPVLRSGTALVEYPAGGKFVRLRIKVSSAHCTLNDDPVRPFRLFRGDDSPVFYFSLTPVVTGQIDVRIELYQEEDLIGSARIHTNAAERLAGEVKMVLQSVTVEAARITNGSKQSLAKALLRCQAVSDRKVRNAIVEDLPENIRDSAERSDNALLDVRNIITRCLDYRDGLNLFIQGVRDFEGDSVPMAEVDRLLAEMGLG